MPPKMDRAEAVFDDIQATLDKQDIAKWKPQEMEVLLSLMETYYTDLKTQKILERSRRAKEQGGEKGDSDDEEDEEEEEEDEEDVEYMERVAAINEVDRALASVRAFLQRKLPFGAIPEPTIRPADADADAAGNAVAKRAKTENGASGAVRPAVYSIDSFLYLEEDVEELVSSGAISRHYCTDCGSVNIAPTDFITHSFSQDQLVYLSCFLLPALGEEGSGMTTTKVVDVGSRLGIVMWACYFAARQQLLHRTESVVGVEMDTALVSLQEEVGKKFCSRPVMLLPPSSFDDDEADGVRSKKKPAAPQPSPFQWSVVPSDCFTGAGAAQLADAGVIILHNVFEYFCKTEMEHLQCWIKLRSLVKRKGQVLICCPSMEETFMDFSEAALEACGILEKEATTGEAGQKRSRAAEAEDEEAMEPTRKNVAIARWLADYVDVIDDEVEDLAEEFIAFRTNQDGDEEEEEEEEEGCCGGDDRGHSHSHGHSHGHSHEHDDGCCSGGGGCEDGEGEEPSEMAEQIRRIWVYRVK